MSFNGFPAGMEFTPVPRLFITAVAPALSAPELKLMLAVFALIYQKKGRVRSVSATELEADTSLMQGLAESGAGGSGAVERLLGEQAERGLLLKVVLVGASGSEVSYFLNSPAEARVVAAIGAGKLKPAAGRAPTPAPAPAPPADIFSLYEANIGLITPMIAEELKDALQNYPEEWIRQALREAVSLNKRSWRYALRILERWRSEGKTDGAYQPDTQANTSKYTSGRYGKLVRH